MEKLTACQPKEPFVKLNENGQASILNYNLPQSTCYDATSFISLNVRDSYFKVNQRRKPGKNFWSEAALASLENIYENLNSGVKFIGDNDIPMLYDPNPLAGRIPEDIDFEERVEGVMGAANMNYTMMSMTNNPGPGAYKDSKGALNDQIAQKIKTGFFPIIMHRFSGIKHIDYIKEPKKPSPQITMVLHLKMCSYLGDYGAGRTIKTFSLLPGERTNISIRTYEHMEQNRTYAQNVLDSFSAESAEDLQSSIEHEMEHASGRSSQETVQETGSWKVGGKAGISIGPLSIGGGGGRRNSTNATKTLNEAVNTQVNVLVESTSRHTAKANSRRQIDVNTSTTSSVETENERTITRELENINRSRVLNFVFRQLLQEFISITYIHDVSFIYTNGYPSQRKSCKLSGLDDMLSQVLVNNKVVEIVKNDIYTHLCGIDDFKGVKHSLIEKVTERYSNCINPDEGEKNVSYVRIRKGLRQSYEGKSVDGIILDVSSRILRTPSLVVDALLGQGEALDCYNMKLQDAATVKATLDNRAHQQAIDIIEAIQDPKEKAALYKKVFGDCCESDVHEEDED